MNLVQFTIIYPNPLRTVVAVRDNNEILIMKVKNEVSIQ